MSRCLYLKKQKPSFQRQIGEITSQYISLFLYFFLSCSVNLNFYFLVKSILLPLHQNPHKNFLSV